MALVIFGVLIFVAVELISSTHKVIDLEDFDDAKDKSSYREDTHSTNRKFLATDHEPLNLDIISMGDKELFKDDNLTKSLQFVQDTSSYY